MTKYEWIDNFYNDTEHGFFHGLMVSFIMYLINLDSNNPIELRPEHYVSTILHDFLKSNLIFLTTKVLPTFAIGFGSHSLFN